MGLLDWLWSVLYYFGFKKKAKLMLLGLDNAGKTTLLHRIANDPFHPTTNQGRSQEVILGTISFTVYDQSAYRDWRQNVQGFDGILFVVDIADPERFGEVRTELKNVLHNETISELPVAVLANKIDKKDAVDEEMFVNELALSPYRTGKIFKKREELPGRPFEVFPCSVVKLIGYGEALHWLTSYIAEHRQ